MTESDKNEKLRESFRNPLLSGENSVRITLIIKQLHRIRMQMERYGYNYDR